MVSHVHQEMVRKTYVHIGSFCAVRQITEMVRILLRPSHPHEGQTDLGVRSVPLDYTYTGRVSPDFYIIYQEHP